MGLPSLWQGTNFISNSKFIESMTMEQDSNHKDSIMRKGHYQKKRFMEVLTLDFHLMHTIMATTQNHATPPYGLLIKIDILYQWLKEAL